MEYRRQVMITPPADSVNAEGEPAYASPGIGSAW